MFYLWEFIQEIKKLRGFKFLTRNAKIIKLQG